MKTAQATYLLGKTPKGRVVHVLAEGRAWPLCGSGWGPDERRTFEPLRFYLEPDDDVTGEWYAVPVVRDLPLCHACLEQLGGRP